MAFDRCSLNDYLLTYLLISLFTDGAQAATQGIFVTSLSGVDNTGMSSSQQDGVALPLNGLPSYDDVIANSDIYASSLLMLHLQLLVKRFDYTIYRVLKNTDFVSMSTKD